MRASPLPPIRTLLIVSLFACLPLSGGCSELTAEGHISDRETSAPVPDVEILQSKSGSEWRRLGRTDGRGAYWILKSEIKGGGRIRFKKPGYYPLDLVDSEFLGSRSHLITPTGRAPDAKDDVEPADESDPFDSP